MKQVLSLKSVLSSLSRTFVRRKAPGSREEFRAAFESFKNVLEINNRALETITDIGEKLGGDYLFDIVYLKNAYARLKADMTSSLKIFDQLTQQRYQQLHEVLSYIDSLVARMVDDAPPAPSPFVLFFDNIPWGALYDVGGKNAHLAEVKNQLGLNVPDGFVLTASAFDAFVRFNNLENRIKSLKKINTADDPALREVQELIIHGSFP